MRRLKFINLLVAVIIALYQVKQNEAGYPEDTREVNKPKMSVWAQKAGGSWRSGLSPNGKDADSAITEAPAKSAPIQVSMDDSEELLPRERKCDKNKYWHVRGFMCVPYKCPGGNKYRNRHTGECTVNQFGDVQQTWEKNTPYRRRSYHTKRPLSLARGGGMGGMRVVAN